MTDAKPPPPKRPRTPPEGVPEARDEARVAKVMARAGLCSRRDAEVWIAAGRVAVNGAVIASPALNVGPGDRVTVDGIPLPERQETRLFLFHKTRGLVTTDKDPEGRPTIFDDLPPDLPRVVSVGRLDINTEGLMLLTNDGGLARTLELPATGWLRRYRVRANGEVLQPALDALAQGVTIEGVDYAGIEATLDRVQGSNVWLTMGLREGKNREIKRVLEHLGMAVTRLIRVSFGPFQLGEIPVGGVEEVRAKVLREQLGPALAAQAGADLAERPERARGPGRAAKSQAPADARASQPAPAPRAHVSVLRAARAEADAGDGRRRIERAATADRKGRAVAVERVMPVKARAAPADTRNARRFSRDRSLSEDGGAPRRRPNPDGSPGRETRQRQANDRAPTRRPVEGAGPGRPTRAGARAPRAADIGAADTRRPRPDGPRDRGAPAVDRAPARRPREGAGPDRPMRGRPRPFDAAEAGSGGPRRFGAGPPSREGRGEGAERPRARGGDGADAAGTRGGGRPFGAKPRAGGASTGERRPDGGKERPGGRFGARPPGSQSRPGGTSRPGGKTGAKGGSRPGGGTRPGGPRPAGGGPRPAGGGPRSGGGSRPGGGKKPPRR